MDTIITVLAAIIIAAASSWITVHLSLHRFRIEKWWERRADAYERLINAFHNSKEYLEKHLHATNVQEDIPEEQESKLRARDDRASQEIARAIDIGRFLLGEEALDRLKKYQKDGVEADNAHNWQEHLEIDWKVKNDCLQDLIDIARRDLKAQQSVYITVFIGVMKRITSMFKQIRKKM